MINISTAKRFLKELEQLRINYFVSGGFGLDGIRGYITRKHKDIDVWIFAEQLPILFETLKKEKYRCFKKLNKYEIQKKGLLVDILPLTKRLKQRIIFGNLADSYYPQELFSKFQKGKINSFKFKVVPNEIFALEMQFSDYLEDKEMAKLLEIDKSLFSKIKYISKEKPKNIKLEEI